MLLRYLKWSLSVSRKLFLVVPVDTLAVVLASLVSSTSLVLAFLLPLKILMILGARRIPAFFPESLRALGVEQLAIALGVGAVTFYALYLAAARLADIHAERGARRLLERSKKLPFIANHEAFGKQRYQMLARTLANVVFSCLALVVLFLIYPSVAVVVLILLATASITGMTAIKVSAASKRWMETNVHRLVELTMTAIFLLTFGYILLDVIADNDRNLIVSLVGLILSRILLQRARTTVITMVLLNRERHAINAMFFVGHKFTPRTSKPEQDFWRLLRKARRDEFLVDILNGIGDRPVRRVDSLWLQVGIPNVAALKINAYGEEGRIDQKFFVKLFGQSSQRLAANELSLLENPGVEGLPVPRLLAAVNIEKFTCMIFGELSDEEFDEPRDLLDATRFVRMRSWQAEPPQELIDRVRRSVPLLADRLNAESIGRLSLAADSRGDREILARFKSTRAELTTRIRSLPLHVHNARLTPDTMRQQDDGQAVVIDWSFWSLEPIGAGWSVAEIDMEELESYLERASKESERVAACDIEDVRLAARVFAFERLCTAQRYCSALESLPDLLECRSTVAQSV